MFFMIIMVNLLIQTIHDVLVTTSYLTDEMFLHIYQPYHGIGYRRKVEGDQYFSILQGLELLAQHMLIFTGASTFLHWMVLLYKLTWKWINSAEMKNLQWIKNFSPFHSFHWSMPLWKNEIHSLVLCATGNVGKLSDLTQSLPRIPMKVINLIFRLNGRCMRKRWFEIEYI